jgi:hypothetical protein
MCTEDTKAANPDDPVPPPVLPKQLRRPPSPWLQFFVGLLVLAVSITSATFGALNYFRSAKTAGIVLDHFQDNPTKMPFGGVDKDFHQLLMWITNLGQGTAKLHNVAISVEFQDEMLTPEKEAERMQYVASNRAAIGVALNSELVTGQKSAYPSRAGFPDELWSKFTGKNQYLYVFGLITFSDEKSGDQDARTEVCVRLYDLNNWSYCTSGHNQTVR